ncbi:MAG: HD-GYP domain-containing protein [Treponema sp.]|nr:HD-GYP domain-containing protein [Treponema sp.]
MKKIAVTAIKEGAVFSAPVYIEGNNMFVPAGIAVRKKDIARLQSWGVQSVETEGRLIDAASAPEAPGAAPPEGIYEDDDAHSSYMELIERLDEVCASIAGNTPVQASSIDSIASQILKAVREQRHSFIGFILGGEIKGYSTAKSLVNIAILSALMAQELKLPDCKVTRVVTGALLHDTGMSRVPAEIVEKKGGLSPPELQRVQSHTLYGYKIVTRELLYPEDVGLIVLQHHERWDGEGYPRRLSALAIDMGARIVSVADAFEAMVSQKPYRNSMMGYHAMKNLLSDNLRRFDPDVIKAFIQIMGIYPIGSIVLLNNGALARVVNVQGIAPLRPQIKILVNESGTVFKHDEGDSVDLLVEKSLFIAKAVDPREASAAYA